MASQEQTFVTYQSWEEAETNLYLHLQANAKVVKTKWADEDILREMEIHNQVKYLIRKMDMGNLLSMNYATYPHPTLQFLSTANLVYGQGPIESANYLTFRIKDNFYKVSTEEICEIYGFDPSKKGLGYSEGLEASLVWDKIAFGSFEASSAKFSKVRNPTIRYLLELIEDTFVSSSSQRLVSPLSLKLLFQSVKTVMKGPDGEIVQDFVGDDINNGFIFICQMIDYPDGLRLEKNPRIHIGGFLTPLFRYVGVNLGEFRRLKGESKMDMGHLVKENFLYGYYGNIGINLRLIYLFIDEERQRRACYLPLPEHTTATKDENLSFHLPQYLLVNRHTLPSEPRLYKSDPQEDQPNIEREIPNFDTNQDYQEPPMDRQLTEYEKYLKNKVDNQDKVLKKQENFMKRLWRKVTKSEKYNRYASSSEEENEDEDLLEKPRHSIALPPLVIREPRERREPPRASCEEPPRRRHGKDPVGESSRPRTKSSRRRNNEPNSSVSSTKHSYM